MKKIFLVTLQYNTDKETHDWLHSVKKMDKAGFDVQFVIVDNASKIPFVLSKNEQDDKTHLIRSGTNTGFAGGNNIGIRYSLKNGADFVMVINNDTIVEKNLLKELLSVLDSDEKIGIAAPKIYFAKGHEFHKERYAKEETGKVFWYAGGHTDWANVMSVHRGVDEVDYGQYDTIQKVSFASGCCMLIKKEVLKKVGLFDERYFLYYEDADLCERVQRAGYSMMYAPKAVMWHINAASSGGSGNKLQDYFLTRNRMLFGMSYAPLRTKLSLLRESIRLLFNGRVMQQKGILDFYLRKFGKGTYLQ
ncbi:MAG TPA: glycosyltransferase family 2 protein [Patescibacteria group bacterium]|nr:glycosyltransferase family 2 protein [Patescibacteria group bacterium]